MPTTDDRMATLISTCERELRAAIVTHPDRLRRLTIDAPAWRATCKALGITHTSKAITASLRGEDA